MEVETAKQNLAWLTNTRLFAAWMAPARGEVICFRWLRYPGAVSSEFVASFIVHFQSINYDVIYLDCATPGAFLKLFESVLLKMSRKSNAVVKMLLFALICQGYGSAAMLDDRVTTSALGFLLNSPDTRDEDYLGRLRDSLYASLDARLPRNVVVLLHNIGELSSFDLKLLRNQFQDVLWTKRGKMVSHKPALL